MQKYTCVEAVAAWGRMIASRERMKMRRVVIVRDSRKTERVSDDWR